MRIMELSVLSTAEMIQLYSSFVYLTTDGLNCSKTLEKSTKEITSRRHNCDYSVKRQVFMLDHIQWNSCLCRFQHSNFNQLMVMSKHYEHGCLPDEGSLLDQPNVLIEIMETIDHLKNLHKQEQHKEMERKNGNSKHRPESSTRKPAPRSPNR